MKWIVPSVLRGAWVRLADTDEGQDLMEYAVLASLIAVAAAAAISFLGDQVNVVMWQAIAQNF